MPPLVLPRVGRREMEVAFFAWNYLELPTHPTEALPQFNAGVDLPFLLECPTHSVVAQAYLNPDGPRTARDRNHLGHCQAMKVTTVSHYRHCQALVLTTVSHFRHCQAAKVTTISHFAHSQEVEATTIPHFSQKAVTAFRL